MASSRKDSKGRKLKDGESERADGRYSFRYTDKVTHRRLCVYAPTLQELREKEKQIDRDRADGLLADCASKNLTLNSLFERYLQTIKLAKTTRMNYEHIWNNRVRNAIGNIKVVQLHTSLLKAFYVQLSDEGYSYSTIKLIHNLIRPALETAVEDDIIRKNPADKAFSSDYGTQPKEKRALTVEEQENLLEFVKQSSVYNVYENMLTILLDTGLRCGELVLFRTLNDASFFTLNCAVSV